MKNMLLESKDYSIDSLIQSFKGMHLKHEEWLNECKAIKKFIAKYMLLPLIEWCSLYFYLEAGNLLLAQPKLLPIPYVSMLALFALVIRLKFYILRSLQQSDVEYVKIAVEITLQGQVGGCMPNTIKKVVGKYTPIVLVIRSMPAYLSGSTSFLALPGTLDKFAHHPEINRSWNASWGGHMPLSLAQCFLYLLTSMTIIHIIGFYYYTWKAWLLSGFLEELQKDMDAIDYERESAEVRSTIWHHIAEAASQGNLLVISQTGDTIVQAIHAAHRIAILTVESRAAVGVANVSLRIFAYAEVLAWLKISLLAEGFDYLGTIGCIELAIAIGMGLLTVAFTMPDQIDALDGGSTRDVVKKGVMLMMTSILLIMLCFRLIAVFFICEKHIYNFSELGCFDESATWVLLASNAMLFFVACMSVIAILYRTYSAMKEAREREMYRHVPLGVALEEGRYGQL